MVTMVQRSSGKASAFAFDKGNAPADFGPLIGEVVNNVDSTRSGKLQVYIEQFGGGKKNAIWGRRTVSPIQPVGGGSTPKTSTSSGVGSYGSTSNQQSYGSASAAPDIGTKVICYFVAGDPNQGYYMGTVPSQGGNHMTPALGASPAAVPQNENQSTYFAKSPQLPVTEINNAEQNTAITENPKFFDQKKPVHSYLASTIFQQGIVNDPIRGPINSSSQRESPSTVTGTSTPGRPVYQGGMQDSTVEQKVASGSVSPEDTNIVGRRGGHSMVMDDGDVGGKTSLIRIRSAKGHQITLSDDGNNLYISHANGQVWLEFGQEGTLDVYTTNSINLRTEGTINLHADKDFNVWAGGNINMKSNISTTMQSEGTFTCANKDVLTLFSQSTIGIKSGGALCLDGKTSSWNGGGSLALQAGTIDLNPGSAASVAIPQGLVEYTMPDSSFNASSGWAVASAGTKSIVTRAPAHEPWPYHNQGVQVNVNLSDGTNSSPPGAPTVPTGTSITKTN
jgi:hypothetical protein